MKSQAKTCGREKPHKTNFQLSMTENLKNILLKKNISYLKE